MNTFKPYTIFAPHIDDEMIGCFSILDTMVDRVVYFFDISETRRREAIQCANWGNFTPIFNSSADYLAAIWDGNLISPDQIILLPNSKDKHPHHKIVNSLGRKFPNKKMYYSVDMNTSWLRVLSSSEQSKKKSLLDSLYPSQKGLWGRDAKYYLFESLHDSDLKKFVWVTFQHEGIHAYPNAPDDVAFLRYPHRHIFKFKVHIEVFHSDREREFIQEKRWMESLFQSGTLELNNKSCEMIAEELYDQLEERYRGEQREVKIEVSEDGENGCLIYFPPSYAPSYAL